MVAGPGQGRGRRSRVAPDRPGEVEWDLFDPAAVPGLPCVLVAGAEGTGLRELTRKTCHRLVRIPMAGRVESLNASVAVAIALFELRRREPSRVSGRP